MVSQQPFQTDKASQNSHQFTDDEAESGRNDGAVSKHPANEQPKEQT